jgi:hypothetical protein
MLVATRWAEVWRVLQRLATELTAGGHVGSKERRGAVVVMVMVMVMVITTMTMSDLLQRWMRAPDGCCGVAVRVE